MHENIINKDAITIDESPNEQQTRVDDHSDAPKTVKVTEQVKKKPMNPTPL